MATSLKIRANLYKKFIFCTKKVWKLGNFTSFETIILYYYYYKHMARPLHNKKM